MPLNIGLNDVDGVIQAPEANEDAAAVEQSPRARLQDIIQTNVTTAGTSSGMLADQLARELIRSTSSNSRCSMLANYLSPTEIKACQEATFDGFLKFIVDFQSQFANSVTQSNLSSDVSRNDILAILSKLSNYLNDIKSSPFTPAERKSQQFENLIQRVSPDSDLIHRGLSAFSKDDLKSFAQLFDKYVDSIMSQTKSAADSIKASLSIFPPEDNVYHCTGGTINRLILAQQALIAGPKQLLMNLYSERQQEIVQDALTRIQSEGDEIHLPTAVLYLLTANTEEILKTDPFFRLPLPSIDAEKVWESYGTFYTLFKDIAPSIDAVADNVKDIAAVTVNEHQMCFQPWSLEAWDDMGLSFYKSKDDFKQDLYKKISQTLGLHDEKHAKDLKKMPKNVSHKLPDYTFLTGFEGEEWLMNELLEGDRSTEMQQHALHALFLMSALVENNAPAVVLDIVLQFGKGQSFDAGIDYLKEKISGAKVAAKLDEINDRIISYRQVNFFPKNLNDAQLVQCYNLLRNKNENLENTCKLVMSTWINPQRLSENSNSNGNTIFHELAAINNFEAIEFLQNTNTFFPQKLLKKQNKQGKTPLDIAFENQHIDTVNIMINILNIKKDFISKLSSNLDAVFEVEDVEKFKFLMPLMTCLMSEEVFAAVTSPLMLAAEKGYVEILKSYVQLGYSLDTFDSSTNLNLMMHCAQKRNEEAFKNLLDAGANANIKNIHGMTPLNVAAHAGLVDMICSINEEAKKTLEQIIKAGYSLDDIKTKTASVLLAAVQKGKSEEIELFKALGFDFENYFVGNTSILGLAITNDNRVAVSNCLKFFPNIINTYAYGKEHPLLYALDIQCIAIAQMLVEAGAKIDQVTSEGLTFVQDALSSRNVLALEFLHKKGVNVNLEYADGSTALSSALKSYSTDLAEFFLEKTECLHQPNKQGFTPMEFAVQKGDECYFLQKAVLHNWPSIVQALKDAGADLNQPNRDGSTLSQLAFARGNINILRILKEDRAEQVIKTLSEAGFDLQQAGNFSAYLKRAVLNNQPIHASLLVEIGADVNQADEDGIVPLSQAALQDSAELISVLLEAGAKINHFNNMFMKQYKKTALALAVEKGNLNAINALLVAGAQTNLKTAQGLSPLQLAIKNNQPEVIRALHNAGVDLNVLEKDTSFFSINTLDDFTPLSQAVRAKNLDSLKALIDLGANPTLCNLDTSDALELAFASKDLKVTELVQAATDEWIETKAPNKIYKDGSTPLLQAVDDYMVGLDKIKRLLANGADVNGRHANSGNTPLYLAAERDDFAKTSILLAAGADPGLKNNEGFTPLQITILNGNASLIPLFRYSGIDFNQPQSVVMKENSLTEFVIIQQFDLGMSDRIAINTYGPELEALNKVISTVKLTPLSLASYLGNPYTVQALLNIGADPKIYNSDGRKALDVAIHQNNTAVIDILSGISPEIQRL